MSGNRKWAHRGDVETMPPWAAVKCMSQVKRQAPAERTALGHGITAFGHVQGPCRKMPRIVQEQQQPVIDEERRQALHKRALEADDVRDGALAKLAKEHLSEFKSAFGGESQHAMGPNREVRVGTACTGSGTELFSLLAILEAFRDECPELKFKYMFHCEKNPSKRRFVQVLHKHLGHLLGNDHVSTTT